MDYDYDIMMSFNDYYNTPLIKNNLLIIDSWANIENHNYLTNNQTCIFSDSEAVFYIICGLRQYV